MKGYIQTLEAVVGALLIMVAIIYFYTPSTKIPESELSKIAYNCLKNLDDKGLLRHYMASEYRQELKNALKDCMPESTDFYVCTTVEANCYNIIPEQAPKNKTVILADYLVYGEHVAISTEIIKLWVWSVV